MLIGRSKATFFFGQQNLAFAGVVGRPDTPFVLHPLHQRGGAIVTDLQPALDVTGRSLAVTLDDLDRLRKQVALAAATHPGGVEYGLTVFVLLFRGNRFE